MSADREIKQPESRTGDSSSGFTGHTHLDRAKPPAPFDERYLACGTAQPSRCPRLPLNCPHSLNCTRVHAMRQCRSRRRRLRRCRLPHCRSRRRRLRRCLTRTARVAVACAVAERALLASLPLASLPLAQQRMRSTTVLTSPNPANGWPSPLSTKRGVCVPKAEMRPVCPRIGVVAMARHACAQFAQDSSADGTLRREQIARSSTPSA